MGVPSGDELAPNASCPVPMSHSLSSFIDSDSDGEKGKSSGYPSANPATPKRAGDEPSAPPPQRSCAASEAARRGGVSAVWAKCQLPPGTTGDFMCIAESDIDHACRYPLRGWPSYKEIIRMGNLTRLLLRQISNVANLRCLPEDHVVTCEGDLGHMSAASERSSNDT